MKQLILVINPGSTSTKIALFEEETPVFETTLHHSSEELSVYKRVSDQFNFRRDLIIQEMTRQNADFKRIAVVVGRGGLIHPIESGIYRVNDKMIDDLVKGRMGEHASNLGGLLAADIASSLPAAEAFIVDPVVVDELQPLARISGHPEIERVSIFHALNQKAVARAYASSAGRRYEDMNLIVVHMGGGITIGAHCLGKVIDVNNALNGDGPFSPERSGGLPSGQLIDLCFSGKYTYMELKSMITGKGGLVAYLGTNNFVDVCGMADAGNQRAIIIRDALAYQIAKEIGAMAAVLKGKVDAIILTGGLAHQQSHVARITEMVGFISKVVVYPGENEVRALALNGLLVLKGMIEVRDY